MIRIKPRSSWQTQRLGIVGILTYTHGRQDVYTHVYPIFFLYMYIPPLVTVCNVMLLLLYTVYRKATQKRGYQMFSLQIFLCRHHSIPPQWLPYYIIPISLLRRQEQEQRVLCTLSSFLIFHLACCSSSFFVKRM